MAAASTVTFECTSGCSPQCPRSFVRRMFPFLGILRGYSLRHDLPRDVLAGLTVGVLNGPQGMAYSLLLGLPPVYGLYASVFPALIYFLFGTSRHASIGTFAVACIMVGRVVREGVEDWEKSHHLPPANKSHHLPPANDSQGNSTEAGSEEDLEHIKVAYAMSVTFAIGLFQLVLGVARAGRMASFMSDSLISGFIMGATLHVLVSQLAPLVGLTIAHHSGYFRLLYEVRDFILGLRYVHVTTMLTSLVSIATLLVVKEGVNNNKKHFPRLPFPLPVELILIIGATLVSSHLGFADIYDVEIIGTLPSGIPRVDPSVLQFVPRVLSRALSMAFILYALSYAIVKLLADKHAYTVGPNQELVALGMVNVLGCFFSSFYSCMSLSRSMVQDQAGGRTQIAGVVSSIVVLVVLLCIAPLLYSLPNCVLSAIVVVSLKGLFRHFTHLPRLWRVSKLDFVVWMVVFLCTVAVDIDAGLIVGFVANLFGYLFTTQTPYACLLGQIEGTKMYADIKGHTKVREVPGVKIFRFEMALYFGNVHYFRRRLETETGLCVKDLKHSHTRLDHNSHKTRKGYETLPDDSVTSSSSFLSTTFSPLLPPTEVKVIIVDGSTLQTLDSLTLTTLIQIIKDYREVGIDVFLAECKPTVSAMLDTSGFCDDVGQCHVFTTIQQAVDHALQDSSSPLPCASLSLSVEEER